MSQESTESILRYVLEAMALAYPPASPLPPVAPEEAATLMYDALMSCQFDWGQRGWDEYEYQKFDKNLVGKAIDAYRRTPAFKDAP